jgi:hypothetical protein
MARKGEQEAVWIRHQKGDRLMFAIYEQSFLIVKPWKKTHS